jgi:hypothetical protein
MWPDMSESVEKDAFLDAVLKLMADTRNHLNGIEVYPRQTDYADFILLRLLSKSIVLTEAV